MIKLLLAAAVGSIATASFLKMKNHQRVADEGAGTREASGPEQSLQEMPGEGVTPMQHGMVMAPPDRSGNNVFFGS